MKRPATLMAPGVILDLKHNVAAVALEINLFLIPLIERDAQFVVIEVDRFIQIFDLEENFLNTDKSHRSNLPSVLESEI